MTEINMDRRHPSSEIIEIKDTLQKQDLQLNRNEERMIIIERNLLANTQSTLANGAQMALIAKNTEPLVALVSDLTAGTKFLCRLALGVAFVLEQVNKIWKPTLIIVIALNLLLNHQIPIWVKDVISFFKITD